MTETRQFESDLEIRAQGDGRTIVGLAVPYNKEQRITRNSPKYSVQAPSKPSHAQLTESSCSSATITKPSQSDARHYCAKTQTVSTPSSTFPRQIVETKSWSLCATAR